MRIIYFEENEKEILNKFIAENNSESFLQSWEWGEFNRVLGRKVWRMGVVEDGLADENKTKVSSIKYQVSSDNLIAVALVVKHNLPFGKSYLYCPRGPAVEKSKIKNQKSKILNLLINEIRKTAKKEGAMFLRIDPPVGLNNELGIMNYEYSFNFKKSPNEIQPGDTLILDLTKSEEDLLKEMKQKTRYNIRLAERKGVRIINTKYQIPNTKYFNEFWKLVEETSERDKFASHNKNYYWKMLENLGCGDEEISEIRLRAKLYLAEYENKIIASNIVLHFGDLAVYLHGASSGEYRNVMAPHLLQWEQILDAKKAGCGKYDFWGIARDLNMEYGMWNLGSKFKIQNSKFQNWGGITRFKKGFGGEEKNYIGAYDAVFDNIGYAMYKFVKSIKY